MGWTGNNQQDGSFLFDLDLAVSILSFISGVVMIILCLRVRHKSVPIKLLISIAASDLLYTTSNFMSVFETDENGSLCHAEAWLRQFSVFMSTFMITSTSIVCYKSAKLDTLDSQELFFKRAVVLGLLFSLAMAFMPLYFPLLGYENGIILCYISVNPAHAGTAAQIATFMCQSVPLLLSMAITFTVYLLTIRKIKSLSEPMAIRVSGTVYRLLWYPAVPLILQVPAIVDVFLKNEGDTSVPVWLQSLHMVLTHSIGLANSTIYGVQMKVLHRESEEQATRRDNTTIVLRPCDSSDLEGSRLSSPLYRQGDCLA